MNGGETADDRGEAAAQTILIIDDDPLMAEVLGTMLGDLGRIVAAASGAEGLKLAAAHPPDVILLDVEMPGMDGFEVCASLRRDDALRDVPLIFVTAHSSPVFEARGLDAGAVDFIAKPLNPPIIRRRVRTHLTLKRQSDELRRMAGIDGLTRIANRRTFDATAEQEWRRSLRTGQVLSLAMIDVDHFKKFNDHYGHIIGDECLRMVAGAIRNAAKRSVDLVARYGGEEFAIILPGAAAGAANALGTRVIESVAERKIPHAASATAPIVTISIGVATITFDQSEPPQTGGGDLQRHVGSAVATADRALYQAKAEGRNRMSTVVQSVRDVVGARDGK
jgi:diguanylate cyclase (GGDEF)-like protein